MIVTVTKLFCVFRPVWLPVHSHESWIW